MLYIKAGKQAEHKAKHAREPCGNRDKQAPNDPKIIAGADLSVQNAFNRVFFHVRQGTFERGWRITTENLQITQTPNGT